MPFKNRIFLIILVIVIVALAAVLLAPIAVSNGVRLWSGGSPPGGFVAHHRQSRRAISASLVIRQIHLKSVRDNAVRVMSLCLTRELF